MLTITQSQDIQRLFAHLVADMRGRNQSGELGVFDQYQLIVPATSVKTWIMNELASTQGISAMVYAKFWGSYQWQLMADVLDATPLSHDDVQRLPPVLAAYYRTHYRLVPKNPNLSIGFMQWRIFALLQMEFSTLKTLPQRQQHTHLLYDFFEQDLANTAEQTASTNNPNSSNKTNNNKTNSSQARWWQLAQQIAQVFSAYLTHRPEWLAGWSGQGSQHTALDVAKLVADKDQFNQSHGQATTPEWLVTRYENVAKWQQYIWQALFVADFQYRQALYAWFWERLANPAYQSRLPKQITFFTLPPVPKAELDFIRRLAGYTDVTFLHYNPSQEYWADITDPYWLGKCTLSQPDLARLRDTGHFLLARMGKQARDTFKLLISLSGGVYDDTEQVNWQDDFVEKSPTNLLQQLQQDILLLQEEGATNWQISHANKDATKENTTKENAADDSIRINACHSLVRQLEVLREDITLWLNADANRQPSDILVMLPDLAGHEATIKAVFPNHAGVDGFILPTQLTGLLETETQMLWQALSSKYQMLDSSLPSDVLFAWLMLPPVYESVGLNREQMQRGCELLVQAGFKRGFDGTHLAQFLAGGDGDERFTLRYALDRLAMGLLMPAATYFTAAPYTAEPYLAESTTNTVVLPLSSVTLADTSIIAALLTLYAQIQSCRGYSIHSYATQSETHSYASQTHSTVAAWLNQVLLPDMEANFHLYRGQQSWQEIISAMQNLQAATDSLLNDGVEQSDVSIKPHSTTPPTLDFVLTVLGDALASGMRGSEPTGAITFCRMGTVRPVPYKLVVLLNMNIGEYPQREQPNHFNLMQAGQAQVGDRQREDDETGAFLDALMMAEQACWFFYNGFSTTDIHTHLPANPLQELMLFLQGIYTKQPQASEPHTQDTEQEKTEQKQTANPDIPQFIAHPALPFSQESFADTPAQRHQGFWYDIYQTLYVDNANKQDDPAKQPSMFIHWQTPLTFPEFSCLITKEVTQEAVQKTAEQTKQQTAASKDHIQHSLFSESVFLDGHRLLNDLAKPAQHFLRSQQISVTMGEDAIDTIEPLTLDALTEYAIRNHLLADTAHSTSEPSSLPPENKLLFDHLLPAGVAKAAYFEKAQAFYHAQLASLQAVSAEGQTHTADTVVSIGHYQITYPLPVNAPETPSMWAYALPTNGNNEAHQLKQWLAHLLWQVARNTTAAQVANGDGVTVCVYKNVTVQYQPVLASEAMQHLQNWLAVWAYNQHTPVVLPPKWGVAAAKCIQKDTPLSSMTLNEWLNGSAHADYVADDTSLHPAWQIILQGSHAYDTLLAHAEVFAERLYLPMLLAQG